MYSYTAQVLASMENVSKQLLFQLKLNLGGRLLAPKLRHESYKMNPNRDMDYTLVEELERKHLWWGGVRRLFKYFLPVHVFKLTAS